MHRVLSLPLSIAGFLLAFGPAHLSAQATVDVAFGLGGFHGRTQVQGLITFSELPQTAFVSSNPGGDGESTYYDSFMFQGVKFQTVNWNLNKPGQRRLSDVGNSGVHELYNVNSGNLLIPGLGQRLSNDDGVLIDFTQLNSPINAFGANFGSVQETSPCCVQQLFSLELSNGEVHDILFSSGNYGGRETELSHSTFTGFHVRGAYITRVQIEQLGHNPILDNVMWGTTKPEAIPGRPHIILNFPNPPGTAVPPTKKIELVDPTDASTRKLIDDMKPDWGKNVEDNRFVSRIAEIGAILPIPRLKAYLRALADFTEHNALIFTKMANDPPRFDYDIVAEYEANENTIGFVDEFGSDYELIDETFLIWDYALANLDLAFITLERLQGAIVDGDGNARERQGDALVFFLSEADHGFETVARNLEDILILLRNTGIEDFEINDPTIRPTTFFELNAFAAETVSNGRTIVILRTGNGIFSDGFESGSGSAWSVTSPLTSWSFPPSRRPAT